MNKIKSAFRKTFNFFENNFIFICIRNGLIVLLPFIIVGSFALIITQFPNSTYQNWISDIANGYIYDFFDSIYTIIFKYYALLLSASIAYFFVKQKDTRLVVIMGVTLLSVVTTLLISYVGNTDSGNPYGNYDTSHILTSLLSGTLVPLVSLKLMKINKFKMKDYSRVSTFFQDSMNLILPFTVILVFDSIIALFTIHALPQVDDLMEKLFNKMGVNIGSTIFLEFISHITWFFGVHGNNLFQSVFDNVYALGSNKIFSKVFLDTFVLMGGAGMGISLLLSVMIFSKQKALKHISGQGVIPAIFNVNEILIFGIPIVLNPIMLIPFILVPIASLISTYIFTITGFLPHVTHTVTWTCPVFFSGYIATSSIKGIIVQAFNIALGILIYFPFVKVYDKYFELSYQEKINTIYVKYKEAQKTTPGIKLSNLDYAYSGISKSIARSLKEAIKNESIRVFYQPIVDKDEKIVSYEALLRYGEFQNKYLNPELLITIAREEGFIYELHQEIFKTIFRDTVKYELNQKISFNVDTEVLLNPKFKEDLLSLIESYNLSPSQFTIEITETVALTLTDKVKEDVMYLKEKGFKFAIDDFAAGETSLKYIQLGIFDTIKIDGSITRLVVENKRSLDIITSILYLAKKSDLKVLCEYVENVQIFRLLKNIGVDYYQGFYFSQAIMPELVKIAFDEK